MLLAPIPGVFAPISDSWLLARALEAQLTPGSAVLDLCTGSGVLAITAARSGARATAVDSSRRAVLAARLNARLNGTRVRARRGRLFEPVAGERFEIIVSNPPYVPSERAELPRRGRRRAWDAGPTGRAVIDPIIDAAPRHLVPGGSLLLVHSSVNGVDETLRRMRDAGLRPDVLCSEPGRLGPLMSARVRALEERGLLAAGERTEEVLVVRGRAPKRHIPAKSGMIRAAPLAV